MVIWKQEQMIEPLFVVSVITWFHIKCKGTTVECLGRSAPIWVGIFAEAEPIWGSMNAESLWW